MIQDNRWCSEVFYQYLMNYYNLVFLTCMALCHVLTAQHRHDTLHTDSTHTHDSHYTHENIPKSKIWGNSWYMATAFNLSRSIEPELNLGRTLGTASCSGGGCIYTMRSWGLGYGIVPRSKAPRHVAKAFWEYSLFYYPPIAFSLRGDYMFDISDRTHYIRPSFGLSLMHIDLLYSYSLKLIGGRNVFGHGLTLRLKYFYKKDKWHIMRAKHC